MSQISVVFHTEQGRNKFVEQCSNYLSLKGIEWSYFRTIEHNEPAIHVKDNLIDMEFEDFDKIVCFRKYQSYKDTFKFCGRNLVKYVDSAPMHHVGNDDWDDWE